MGADLILAMYRSPHKADGTSPKPSAELAAELKRRWAALDGEAKTAILEQAYGTCWTSDSEEAVDEWQRLTAEVHELIDDLYGEGGGQLRRDMLEIKPEEQWWTVTGGMSSGDDPTDAYCAVEAIAASGITVEPV